MSFLSMEFLLFLLLVIAGYYLMPGRFQWVWLLVFSYVFYLSAGVSALIYILSTTVSTYLVGLLLSREDRLLGEKQPVDREQKKQWKQQSKTKKKWLTALALVFNFGILAYLKYRNFAVENINSLFGSQLSVTPLLLPLGISFYTFQSMGYLIDVYRGKYPAETNLFRFALFVSYFPQILQGPIGRFDRLAPSLFSPHTFSLLAVERGLQLMLWGYFKKMVIADRAAILVYEVFGNYTAYSGISVLVGVLAYSIQLYGDFSGGMDVIAGASACLSIPLDQNFKRPYFARSISDFWHRWHITLGTWMKDYVFYPVSLSKPMNRFGKLCKQYLGNHMGRVLPVALANLLVFLIVGIWHGAAWKFIVYGLYNGLLIAGSNLFAPVFAYFVKVLHIPVGKPWWTLVQIVRTFILVNISWYFDMATDLSAACMMIRQTFVSFRLSTLYDGSLLTLGLDRKDYLILLLSCLVWFTVSFLQEKQISIRDRLSQTCLPVKWALYLLLLFSIPLLGQIQMTGGGFIYAQF